MEKEKKIMKNNLPDVELYHQELLRNIELRRRLKAKRQNNKASLSSLDDAEAFTSEENEDKEFTESYIKSCGLIIQR